MPLTLMLITNDRDLARLGERHGVDWIFVDLETIGKEERQGHLDTVRSDHTIGDITAVRRVINRSKLIVRSNPIHPGSPNEIDSIVEAGADIVMLPYFSTTAEVEQFISLVANRTQTCLLLETPGAVENIDHLLQVPGIDFVHVGLNDLHLGMKKSFMFELLSDGTLDRISAAIRRSGIPFGFGGIARLGEGALPADFVIPEHYRLGSTMAILSRSFLNTKATSPSRDSGEEELRTELGRVRAYENDLNNWSPDDFHANSLKVRAAVADIVNEIAIS